MDYEKRKKNYFDKLKNIGLPAIQNDNDFGISNTQNVNDSTCFNESNPQYVKLKCEPDNLLNEVQRYIKANPSSHVTKGSLTVGKYQRSLRSNVENKNNADVIIHTDRRVQDSADIVSPFINPKRMRVNREPDSEIKIVPTNVTSTVKQRVHPSGNVHNRIPLRIINRNTREFSSESSGREIKKRKSTINVDEKDNSSITNSSLYVQFVMSQCNEIKSVMQNVYPDNDNSARLRKELLQIKLKHQDKRNVNDSNSYNSPDQDGNDSFKNISDSIFSTNNNFISQPVTQLSNTSDNYAFTPLSDDSFVCSSPELLFNENSTIAELNDEQFSSPETYRLWERSSSRSYSKPTSRFIGFQ